MIRTLCWARSVGVWVAPVGGTVAVMVSSA
jgi:hypothetical protein